MTEAASLAGELERGIKIERLIGEVTKRFIGQLVTVFQLQGNRVINKAVYQLQNMVTNKTKENENRTKKKIDVYKRQVYNSVTVFLNVVNLTKSSLPCKLRFLGYI